MKKSISVENGTTEKSADKKLRKERERKKSHAREGTVDEEIRPSGSCLSDSNENCKLIACQGKWSPGSLSSLSNEINGYSFHPRPLTFCIRVIAQ